MDIITTTAAVPVGRLPRAERSELPRTFRVRNKTIVTTRGRRFSVTTFAKIVPICPRAQWSFFEASGAADVLCGNVSGLTLLAVASPPVISEKLVNYLLPMESFLCAQTTSSIRWVLIAY